MTLIDCHCHTRFSADGHGDPRELCLQAIEHGLTQVALTDHLDSDPADPARDYFDYEACRAAALACRDEFADKLQVAFGVEMDFQLRSAAESAAGLEGREFDLVIGSAHYVGGEMGWVDETYESLTENDAYTTHFEGALATARSGLIDVLAHLDLVKRYAIPIYGPCDLVPYADIIDEILRECIDRGLALEVNTSGLRQAPEEPFPGPAIIGRYRELGGELIAVGSDCHRPSDVGKGIAEAIDMIRTAGFKALTVFEDREAKFVDI